MALEKKSGGVRPIAVGCTLRRLVAKVASQMILEEMAELISPRQHGYGVRRGAEAAVQATRKYLQNLPNRHALLKLACYLAPLPLLVFLEMQNTFQVLLVETGIYTRRNPALMDITASATALSGN